MAAARCPQRLAAPLGALVFGAFVQVSHRSLYLSNREASVVALRSAEASQWVTNHKTFSIYA